MAKKTTSKKAEKKVSASKIRPVKPIPDRPRPTDPIKPVPRPGVDPNVPDPRFPPPEPTPIPFPFPNPTIGLPFEGKVFKHMQIIAESMNALGESVKEAYNFKPVVVKLAEMPKIKGKIGDGRNGLIHEKWMFNMLKTFSTNLNKVSIAMQKDVQKAIKANAAAKKSAKKTKKKASKTK